MERHFSNFLVIAVSLFISTGSFAEQTTHGPLNSNQAMDGQIMVAGGLGDLFGKVKETFEKSGQKSDKKSTDDQVESISKEASNENVSSFETNELTKDEIKEIQRLLSDKGFDPGPIDGAPGRKTKIAIQEYQEKSGLEVNGKVNETLLIQLRTDENKYVVSSDYSDANNVAVVENDVSHSAAKYSPFGIPLSAKFSTGYFKDVFSNTKKVAVGNRIYLYPKETHPAFIFYSVALDEDGYIRSILAQRHSHSTRYATGKAIKYSSQQECLEMSASIGDALEDKYGHAKKKEVVNNGSMYLTMIDNPEISIDFRARCSSNDKSIVFNMKISDAVWEKQKAQESAEKSQKEMDKAKKANNVF